MSLSRDRLTKELIETQKKMTNELSNIYLQLMTLNTNLMTLARALARRK